jgi:hypothetical protein
MAKFRPIWSPWSYPRSPLLIPKSFGEIESLYRIIRHNKWMPFTIRQCQKLQTFVFTFCGAKLNHRIHSSLPPPTKKNLKAFIAKAQQECVHISLCCVHMYIPTVQHTYVHRYIPTNYALLYNALTMFQFSDSFAQPQSKYLLLFCFGYFSKKVTRI